MLFRDVIELAAEGQYSQARELIPQIDQPGAHILQRIAECYILRLEERYDEAIDHARETVSIVEESESSQHLLLTYSEYLVCLDKLGLSEDVLALHDKIIGLLKSLDKEEVQNSAAHIAVIHNIFGIAHASTGDREMALDHYERSIFHFKRRGLTEDVAGTLGNIGLLYHNEGELHRALSYYNNALSLIGDSNPYYKSMLQNNIGHVYSLLGELDNALDYYLLSLEIKENLGYRKGIASTLLNLGDLYFKLGNLSTAEEMMQNSYAIFKELGSKIDIANVLHLMTNVAIYMGKTDIVERNRAELYELVMSSDLEIIKQRYELTLGIIAYHGKRLVNKVVARGHFEKILEMQMLDFEIRLEALKYLIEIYFLELSSVGPEQYILNEIKDLLNEMERIGRKSRSFTVVVESLIFKGKLKLLTGDFDKVLDLLDNAEIICQERELKYLNSVITDLKLRIVDHFDRVKNIADDMQKLEQGQDIIDSYIEDIKRLRNS